MADKQTQLHAARLPAFSIACWVLGLMAFSQLLIAGMALATRFEESQEVRTIVKEVPKLIAVRVPASVSQGQSAPLAAVVSRPPVARPAGQQDPPPPSPVTTPTVADPRAERLLREARQARVAGDFVSAIVKLEEAQSQSPDDPNLHYELGLVHELMGVFDIAAAHYEKVFQMGVTGAGALYEKAATKIRDGFEQPDAMLGKISLSRVQVFKDPDNENGERVILTIPVQKAPGAEVDLEEISVSIVIFNRTSRGEIVQLEDQSWTSQQWISEPCDWADGEETLRMTYTIPPQDGQTEHLFGARNYYGQVVSLLYGETVLDVQAWPRDLAAKTPQQRSAGTPADAAFPNSSDALLPDFDPNLPLFPPLPTE